jgi:hypothetical protein
VKQMPKEAQITVVCTTNNVYNGAGLS